MSKTFIFILLICCSIPSLAIPQNKNDDLLEYLEKKKSIVHHYQDTVKLIDEAFPYNISVLQTEITYFNKEITNFDQMEMKTRSLDENQIKLHADSIQSIAEQSYHNILNSYNRIKLISAVHNQIERETDKLSIEYHRAWNDTFQRKIRADKLFIKEEKVNFYYGTATDVEKVTIRKKNIYEPAMLVYNDLMRKVKNLKQCDYQARIVYLKQAKALLVRIENLLYAENTKDLEKSLRKDEDLDSILDKIYNFELEN